jgi:uncharacterized DUF497 family protein
LPLTTEWDPRKASSNRKKHGVSFEEAATAFADPLSITIEDTDPQRKELRLVLIGRSRPGRLLVVVHVERGDNVRVISARGVTPRERRQYEAGEIVTP